MMPESTGVTHVYGEAVAQDNDAPRLGDSKLLQDIALLRGALARCAARMVELDRLAHVEN